MKKLLAGLCILLCAQAFANKAASTGPTPLPDFAGTYNCTGYDISEGNMQGTVVLMLDAQDTDAKHGYVTYRYKEATTDGEKYTGSIIANGNILSEHFENVEPDEYSDRGVANIIATHDVNDAGVSQTVLHEFYYEPSYGKGDTGTEVCVKQN